MFPLEYPLRVLEKHRKNNPIVMDPFCGRGTTLFAARQLGLVAQGIDSSPVAVAIARAKLCRVNTDATLKLAQSYIRMDRIEEIPTSDFFRHVFTPSVLRQVCAIREGLLRANHDTDVTALLRAAMLGCLHGPMSKKLETQSYFSNQMPRTFSSKPNYSVRYWKEKELSPPKTDVIAVLSRKLSRIKDSTPPESVSVGDTRLGDSRFANSLPYSKRDFSVVVTSPPYYGMKTYVEDQWLRNWFLGGSDYVKYGVTEQLAHTGRDAFAESLGAVWKNMTRTRADELHMYIRFGIIPSSRIDPRELIRDSLESSGALWRIVSTRQASTAASGQRQADHMSANSVAAMEYDFHVCQI
jgi:DNA methylase